MVQKEIVCKLPSPLCEIEVLEDIRPYCGWREDVCRPTAKIYKATINSTQWYPSSTGLLGLGILPVGRLGVIKVIKCNTKTITANYTNTSVLKQIFYVTCSFKDPYGNVIDKPVDTKVMEPNTSSSSTWSQHFDKVGYYDARVSIWDVSPSPGTGEEHRIADTGWRRVAECIPSNLLKNPSFETGDLSDWYLNKACNTGIVKVQYDPEAADGRYSLLGYLDCYADINYFEITQSYIEVTPNKTYDLSFDYMVWHGSPNGVMVTVVFYYDVNGSLIKNDVWDIRDLNKITPDVWHKARYSPHTTSDTKTVDVLFGPQFFSPGAMLLDNFKLKPV